MKPTQYDKPKLYYLEWKDHSGGSGWRETSEIDPDTLIVKSVGWIVAETRDLYLTCAAMDSPGSTVNYLKILKNCITKKKRIYV